MIFDIFVWVNLVAGCNEPEEVLKKFTELISSFWIIRLIYMSWRGKEQFFRWGEAVV